MTLLGVQKERQKTRVVEFPSSHSQCLENIETSEAGLKLDQLRAGDEGFENLTPLFECWHLFYRPNLWPPPIWLIRRCCILLPPEPMVLNILLI